jgi:hypothetical protein
VILERGQPQTIESLKSASVRSGLRSDQCTGLRSPNSVVRVSGWLSRQTPSCRRAFRGARGEDPEEHVAAKAGTSDNDVPDEGDPPIHLREMVPLCPSARTKRLLARRVIA